MLKELLKSLFPPSILDCNLLPLDIKQEEFLDNVKIVTFFDYKYEDVKKLILTLKENESFELLIHLAKIVQPKLQEALSKHYSANTNVLYRKRDLKIYFVPVPARKQRLKEFGFNQTELFAQVLSKLIPHSKTIPLVYRTREISKQAHKNKIEREQEINGTMDYKQKVPEDVSETSLFIIVDDVVTTGSTLKEMYRVLELAGARQVLVLVLARA